MFAGFPNQSPLLTMMKLKKPVIVTLTPILLRTSHFIQQSKLVICPIRLMSKKTLLFRKQMQHQCQFKLVRRKTSAGCGKCGVWKMRGVENAGCGKCGVRTMQGAKNAECGKYVENFNFPFQFREECRETVC